MGRTGGTPAALAAMRVRHAGDGATSCQLDVPPIFSHSRSPEAAPEGPEPERERVQVAVNQLHLAATDLRCAGAALPGRRSGGLPCRNGHGSEATGRTGAVTPDSTLSGLPLPRSATIEFRLLGRFRARLAGREIASNAFGGRRARQLVQILLRERGRLVPRDVLVDSLWPEGEPADPGANLAVLASRARHALGETNLILASRGGYVFADDNRCWVDAESFAADAEQGRTSLASGDADGALRSYRSALALWEGEPFADNLYEEWAQGHRRLFARLYEESLEGAARAALHLGQATVAVHFARILTERVPLHEEGQLVLMKALTGACDPVAAIELFHGWRKALADELGLDPCAEMSDLYQRIVAGESPSGSIRPELRPSLETRQASLGPVNDTEMPGPTREILDWISDAAFVLDPAGRVLYVNRRGADLTGQAACGVVGRPVRAICTEERLPGFCDCAEAALREQAPGHFRGFCPPTNAWLDATLYPGRRGLLVVLRDVTQQVLAEEQVHRALAEVEVSRSELECLTG